MVRNPDQGTCITPASPPVGFTGHGELGHQGRKTAISETGPSGSAGAGLVDLSDDCGSHCDFSDRVRSDDDRPDQC